MEKGRIKYIFERPGMARSFQHASSRIAAGITIAVCIVVIALGVLGHFVHRRYCSKRGKSLKFNAKLTCYICGDLVRYRDWAQHRPGCKITNEELLERLPERPGVKCPECQGPLRILPRYILVLVTYFNASHIYRTKP